MSLSLLAAFALSASAIQAQTVQAQTVGPTESATAAPIPSGSAVDEAAVQAIARSLNCPICEGRNLVDCPLPVCAEMRAEIRTQLASGASRDAIIGHFVAYYGPQVRNTPPLSGPLALAWWVPIAALCLGAIVVIGVIRGRGAVRSMPPAAGEGEGSTEAVMAAGRVAAAATAIDPAPTGQLPGDLVATLERLAHAREGGE